jgi:hypothetical protein
LYSSQLEAQRIAWNKEARVISIRHQPPRPHKSQDILPPIASNKRAKINKRLRRPYDSRNKFKMTFRGKANMSEYIAQLNSIPSAQDLENSNNFDLDNDLAMFTNTQFFDFDLGQDADLQPGNFDGGGSETVAADSVDMKALDFSLQGTFLSYLFLPIYTAICSFLLRRYRFAVMSLSLLPLGSCRTGSHARRIG